MCTNCGHLRSFEDLVFDRGLSNFREFEEFQTARGHVYLCVLREGVAASNVRADRTIKLRLCIALVDVVWGRTEVVDEWQFLLSCIKPSGNFNQEVQGRWQAFAASQAGLRSNAGSVSYVGVSRRRTPGGQALQWSAVTFH
jgi:hypothetical protein